MLSSLALALVIGPAGALGQDAFTLREEMIPMRDGVRLYTRIFTPASARGPLPIMFIRTPYGIGGTSSRSIEAGYGFLAKDGYIFAFQDARGKFRSEGEFVMLRQPRKDRSDRRAIDEATDAWDSIEWMVKQLPGNNGRVGMTGVSYPGWLTAVAMMEPHPALKAVSPQASPSDMWLGDDFHHNGAFRLSYGFEYAVMMESGKDVKPFAFDVYDTYDWYLRLGTLANVNRRYLNGKIPTWNDFSQRPDYDAFWQGQGMAPLLRKPVTIPNLNVAGWWDQEDFYGPITIYRELEKLDGANRNNWLVVGPWNHGGWMRGDGNSLGPIQFDAATGSFFRDSLMAPFFAHHLHEGRPAPHLAEATVFEAGSNRWRRYDAWPPKAGSSPRSFFFSANQVLSTTAPTRNDANAFDAYVSDPNKPVPYRPRPIPPTYSAGSTWSTWLSDDQRFAATRPDVVLWQTPALAEDLTIAGDISVTLHAAITGSDTDWIVKLIDVYPDTGMSEPRMNGYQFMVANEVFRGRYRSSYSRPQAIVPGKVTDYAIDLHTQAYTFRKGHRVMVQVQSTWFPLIDRNPQKFVPNIFEAKDADFTPSTQRVFRSRRYPSKIVLPVVERVAQ
ncbi:MAG: CocE/NonD family hydrolase [Gemmatimonadaceae bacterium]|nr:CocE/NonD family hydrolase [Gemmatimonadaceae bacterium]